MLGLSGGSGFRISACLALSRATRLSECCDEGPGFKVQGPASTCSAVFYHGSVALAGFRASSGR